MSNHIQLLPDPIANQIAAGEVIQRPASVVKELLENAIDAGATNIQLIIVDAGKTKIQVIDNGVGMNPVDARMCFEKHATSKITKVEDLFNLSTKGFRGEALASIGAIAHVDLKTKRSEDETGTLIEMEGSKIINDKECASVDGTNFCVKNLFYNVPARRKFLKSDSVETKHIIDEFQRVALPHPEIAFQLVNNNSEVYNLTSGSLRQRIVSIFGKSYDEKIVPVKEETSIVDVKGFIGKPENAKKTRGEQYFFVNDRFIKSSYLQHAVTKAYDSLLAERAYPSFFLFLDIDPESIDVNIHPTKTEIKFEEEKSIYAIIRSAVKQALGKYNIAPSLDFDQESSFDQFGSFNPAEPVSPPEIKVDKTYNPFESQRPERSTGGGGVSFSNSRNSYTEGFKSGREEQSWESFFDGLESKGEIVYEEEKKQETLFNKGVQSNLFFQIQGGFIITQMKDGLVIIDQHHAHERVLYEQFLKAVEDHSSSVQQLLFPENIELNASDYVMLEGVLPDLVDMGFDIRPFGKNTCAIYGAPAELSDTNVKALIESLLDHAKANSGWLNNDVQEKLARKLAHLGAVGRMKKMTPEEMEALVGQLFQCQQAQSTPDGKPTMIKHGLRDLQKQFLH